MRNIFVIGDSISMHYGPYLQTYLKGKVGYARKEPLEGEVEKKGDIWKPVGANGGDSARVLSYLSMLKNQNKKFDILLINCGLHDIKFNIDTGTHQVEIAEYKENLPKIIEAAKSMSNGFIWVTTTDVVEDLHNQNPDKPRNFKRYSKDILLYNAAASEILGASSVPCIDLNGFTKSLNDDYADLSADGVHFKEEVKMLQAAYIAGYINAYVNK